MQQMMDAFALRNSIDIVQTWNRAPGAESPIIIKDKIGLAKWGLQPAWAKADRAGPHNARIETAAEKPYFKTAWAKRHCLVPATGFYEWQTTPAGKQPHYFNFSEQMFAFAGLWEKTNVSKVTFTILTQEAAGPVSEIHHRMPVIIPPALYQDWLTGHNNTMAAQSTAFMQDIEDRVVSQQVNNVRHDGPELIKSHHA